MGSLQWRSPASVWPTAGYWVVLSLSLWGQTMHQRKWMILGQRKPGRRPVPVQKTQGSSRALYLEIYKPIALLGVNKVIWIWRNIRRCVVIILDMTSGFSDHCVPDSSAVFHICLHDLCRSHAAEQQLYFFCFCNNQVSLTLEQLCLKSCVDLFKQA